MDMNGKKKTRGWKKPVILTLIVLGVALIVISSLRTKK